MAAITDYTQRTPVAADEVLGHSTVSAETSTFTMDALAGYVAGSGFSSRNLVLGNNQGIQFGTTTTTATGATSTSNILDDYEQGTWTPTGTSLTIQATEPATYTKIGNIVRCKCSVSIGSVSSSSSYRITGLPFSANGNQEIGTYGSSAGAGGLFINGGTFILLRSSTGGFLSGTELSGRTFIRLTFIYETTQ